MVGSFSLLVEVVLILSSSRWTALYGDLSGYVFHRNIPQYFLSIRSLNLPIHVAIIVGETSDWLPGLVERAKMLKVNGGFEVGTDL